MTHLLTGLVLLGLGVWGIISWWGVFGLVMRGVIPFTMIVLGLVAILAGYRKSAQQAARVAAASSKLDSVLSHSPAQSPTPSREPEPAAAKAPASFDIAL